MLPLFSAEPYGSHMRKQTALRHVQRTTCNFASRQNLRRTSSKKQIVGRFSSISSISAARRRAATTVDERIQRRPGFQRRGAFGADVMTSRHNRQLRRQRRRQRDSPHRSHQNRQLRKRRVSHRKRYDRFWGGSGCDKWKND